MTWKYKILSNLATFCFIFSEICFINRQYTPKLAIFASFLWVLFQFKNNVLTGRFGMKNSNDYVKFFWTQQIFAFLIKKFSQIGYFCFTFEWNLACLIGNVYSKQFPVNSNLKTQLIASFSRCKGFFRRALKKADQYECINNDKCKINQCKP
jgi:hypothetical protein